MLGFLIAVFGKDPRELEGNVGQILTLGRQVGIVFEPAQYRQLEAFHTCLPLGARQVDHMRCMLSSSMEAFQPFHAQDILEGGFVYGINEMSKNLVMGNRKKLKNSNGVVVGVSGSGKSMETKLELGQVLVGTGDDILIIDPQGEYREFVCLAGGQYIDFSPESATRFNVFEVPPKLIGCWEEETIREFISSKTDIAAALCKEMMAPLVFNGNHLAIVGRCTRLMYEKFFSLPVGKQKNSPTMFDFRNLMGQQQEEEAADLYVPLETFTDGALKMFACPSNIKTDNRVVAFGMSDLPRTMKRVAMLIVIHILTQRVQYNQKTMKATWFTVDEAQEVYREELGAEELDRAFRTFRKLGGICTMITQNISTALTNPRVKDMISNSEFKLFLDQGGADRNAIAQIIHLSSEELLSLTNSKAGTGILIYGKKIVKLDGRLRHTSRLYELYSTNFHEKAALIRKQEESCK
jgi:type IV secretory pathway VirB4 component